MTAATADISIVIRCKNEERFIGRTLDGIAEQRIDLKVEVIVIDSGSKDRTLDIVGRRPVRLTQMPSHAFTYGRALNLGASQARGRYIINLSAHCIPATDHWAADMLADLRADAETAATYGAQIPLPGVNPLEEPALTAAFTVNRHGEIAPPFSNANCAIRKEVWEKYPFDEKATFAEDFIWSQTLPKQYQIKYVPEAAVYHSHPLRLGYWARRSYDNGVFVQYLRNVYGLEYRWAVRPDGADGRMGSRIAATVGRQLKRSFKMLRFLVENGYLKFVPVVPIYWATEQYWYRKGLADGIRQYGGDKKLDD